MGFKKVFKIAKNPKQIYYRVLWKYFFYELNRLFTKHFTHNPKKQNAIILASYPKSGNTFFRFVWLNIINLIELKSKEVNFKMLDKYMPFESFFEDLRKEWNFKTFPCLLKSHCRYSKRYDTFRAIHLFRDPLDAMISNYHYFSNRLGPPEEVDFSWIERRIFNLPGNNFRDTFSVYLFKTFDSYCSHFKSWMESNAIPASYETLISKDSFDYFYGIFKALGLGCKDEILNKAIELSRKERLKNKTPSKRMAKLGSMHFIRDGSIGQWKTYYGEKELEFVLKRLSFHGLDKINLFPERYRTLLVNWPSESLLSVR